MSRRLMSAAPNSVVLVGLGAEATGALKYFKDRAQVFAFDDDPRKRRRFEAEGAIVIESLDALRSHAQRDFKSEVWLRAPSMRLDDPPLAIGTSHQKDITTYTGYWIGQYRDAVLATVTGTKGKSTSTALCGALLNACNVGVVVGGNIGVVPDAPATGKWVFETSSFQLFDCPAAAAVHAVTSIYPEHLDWHGNLPAYLAAKLRPYALDSSCVAVVPKALQHLLEPLPNPRVIVEDVVQWTDDGLSIFWNGSLARVSLSELTRQRLLDPTLRYNFGIACALTIVSANLSAERCVNAADRVLATWSGLPSRQEVIGNQADRVWVDDALATIPQATVAALTKWAGRRIRLILGGKERQQDFSPLVRYLNDHPEVFVYLYGEATYRLSSDLHIAPSRCDSFDRALTSAFGESQPSDVILFSPAGATPEPGENYISRSAVFRRFASSQS